MSRLILTNTAARRLFLHRHALAEAPVGAAAGTDLATLIDRLGFVQIDSINTVARAHHMILWSRRQTYRPAALKALHEQDRGVFEHWTHDAAILPIHLHRYWHHNFARRGARMEGNWAKWFRAGYEPQFETMLARIAATGPVSTSDVGEGEARGSGGWWDWNPSKTALEWLWHTGKLAVTRRDGFQKVYDLVERVIPEHHRADTPDAAAMVDWACNGALDRLGFADVSELRGFWGVVTPAEARAWAVAAVQRGEVVEIAVQGSAGQSKRSLARPDVLAQAMAAPEPGLRVRILSPFDPALRDRDRVRVPVRLSVPDRGFRARAQAKIRLLRLSCAGRRSADRAGGLQGVSRGERAAGQGVLARAGHPAGGWAIGAVRSRVVATGAVCGLRPA